MPRTAEVKAEAVVADEVGRADTEGAAVAR